MSRLTCSVLIAIVLPLPFLVILRPRRGPGPAVVHPLARGDVGYQHRFPPYTHHERLHVAWPAEHWLYAVKVTAPFVPTTTVPSTWPPLVAK